MAEGPVRPGRVVGAAPVRLGGRRVAAPVRTGFDETAVPEPRRLDDLADVVAPMVDTPAAPAVLARGTDGVYRPMPIEQVNPQRGSVNFLVDELTDVPDAQLLVGDFLTVLAGDDAGTVYEVRED